MPTKNKIAQNEIGLSISLSDAFSILNRRGYDEFDTVKKGGETVYLYRKLLPPETAKTFPHKKDKFDHNNWIEIREGRDGTIKITSNQPKLLAELKTNLNALLAEAGAEKANDRIKAAKLLEDKGDPALRVKMKSLSDPKINTYDLVSYLTDRFPEIREAAEKALVAKGKKAIPALEKVVHDNPSELTKQAAMQVINKISGNSALLAFLSDSAPEVRAIAIKLLSDQGKKVVPALDEIIHSKNSSEIAKHAAKEAMNAILGDPLSRVFSRTKKPEGLLASE